MAHDIENYVFSTVATALRNDFDGVFVTGEYTRTPSRFPHVSIVEMDNYPTQGHTDNSGVEKFDTVAYEVNVYTNLTVGKKAQAKAIMDVIDRKMHSMNFLRLFRNTIPNLEDSTIYRMTARYRAETDGETIYRP